MGKVIAVVNQKGGVGKTTTAVNLASFIAEKNKKVLLIDIDPQGNSTLGLGFDKEKETENIYHDLIESLPIKSVIKKTAIQNLDLIPSNIDLAGAEIELVNIENKEIKLKNALQNIKNDYDIIFIDTPPSLGLLTLNALIAADSALIPMQCEFYALDGLGQLLRTIELVRESFNPSLVIEGVVITMFDSRTNLAVQVVEEIKKKFQDKVYDTIIPRNIRLSEAPSFGQPINIYDKSSRGAKAYERLADEILSMK
ncbi:MAG: AAA family ATPase [Candidatus Goldbacteria bacterium]|nr:AAA family ATPase [Candidatus Goldiibacteriota bacterium]